MWSNKLRSSNFWISIASAILLLLQVIFDISAEEAIIDEIISTILGILVISGIIIDNGAENEDSSLEDIIEDINQQIVTVDTDNDTDE